MRCPGSQHCLDPNTIPQEGSHPRVLFEPCCQRSRLSVLVGSLSFLCSCVNSCIMLPSGQSLRQREKRENQIFSFFFLSFDVLGPHPRHMEVPRLGVELELELPAYTTATAMPGIKPTTSWFLVRFVCAAPRGELPHLVYFIHLFQRYVLSPCHAQPPLLQSLWCSGRSWPRTNELEKRRVDVSSPQSGKVTSTSQHVTV